MVTDGEIKIGDKIDVVVPTGNFGNILAGWYAKNMGLPIDKLICASNKNNILSDFLSDGTYDTNREFYKTMSPSMDILISSNLERLLFEASDKDAGLIKSLMHGLKQDGRYTLDQKVEDKIKEDFIGGYADEAETLEAIKEVWDKYNYLMDTHTAVAYSVNKKIENTPNKRVILSTANPYKFPDSALLALGYSANEDGFENIKTLEKATGIKAPENISNLVNAEILHKQSVKAEKMTEALDMVINK